MFYLAKTIIISITTIICTLLICFTAIHCSEMNRYVSYDGFNIPSILDHRTGKIYSINTTHDKIIETDLLNNIITYTTYNENGSLESKMKDPRELANEYNINN